MNNTIKTPQKSSIFPENPYSATGSCDNTITSPIEVAIGRIAVNFGKISQDKPNFVARVLKITVQKMSFLGGAE